MSDRGPIRIDLSFLLQRPAQLRIAAVTLAFAVVGFLYGTFAPKSYRSTMTVVPESGQKGGVAGLLGGQLGGLAAALDVGGSGADSARIAAVLQSTAVTDALIEKLDLKTRYDKKYQEFARNAVWSACSVKTLPRPNLVQVSCDDADPRFAQKMLLFLAEHGNQVFTRVSSGSASEQVRFLQRNVADLRRQADEAAGRMRDFQEKHQIVDLESQARAVVSNVASLSGQRIAKRMELDYARTYSTRDEATARQLANQLSVMDEQLRDLETPRNDEGKAGAPKGDDRPTATGMLPAALAVPRLRAEYEKLLRDRKVAEATLVFALERLESAKANEARDVSTFQILDPPTLPERHSAPLRSQTTLVLATLGFLGMTFREWRRSRKPSQSP
jgi:capsule polysaccharide export protein KpsE/RkpR